MRSFAAFLASILTLTAAPATELTLVSDGHARVVVVLAAGIRADNLAARVLLSHVQQMSGVLLPTVPEGELGDVSVIDGRLVVSAGPAKAEAFVLLGEGRLTRRIGVTTEGLGAGGIVVKSGANTLALLARDDGSDPRKPALARPVFHLLEALGCRYLWPGEVGKVVPRRPRLTVPEIDVRFTPLIGQRNLRFAGHDVRNATQGLAWLGFTPEQHRAAFERAERTTAEGEWAAWNRLGGNLGITGGHAGAGLRGGWAEHGQAHPEWFALQADGTRDQSAAKERWRLCVSNPQLVEHVARDIIAQLGGKARPGTFSLSPNDGGYSSFCLCDACRKLDPPDGPRIKLMIFQRVGGAERTEMDYVSLTDRYLHYWNAVVERVTQVVPDQLFLVDAYSAYSNPPVRERVHPNLVLRYVPTQVDTWKAWQAAGAQRVLWRPNNLHRGYNDGALKPQARETGQTLQYLSQNGVIATDMDSIYHHWATQGLLYYTAARLSWDPAQDFDALLEDYCRTGFGAGAESVKQYFRRIERDVVPDAGPRGLGFPQIAPESLASLRELLVAAARATAADAASGRRVAFLRAGLEFTAISAEAHRLARVADAGGAVDPQAASGLLERRWQLMRMLLQEHPLAVNVAVVAAADGPLNRALRWAGPSAAMKSGQLPLPSVDHWLNEDQTELRRK